MWVVTAAAEQPSLPWPAAAGCNADSILGALAAPVNEASCLLELLEFGGVSCGQPGCHVQAGGADVATYTI